MFSYDEEIAPLKLRKNGTSLLIFLFVHSDNLFASILYRHRRSVYVTMHNQKRANVTPSTICVEN